jgi:hypothetical protein
MDLMELPRRTYMKLRLLIGVCRFFLQSTVVARRSR